MSGPVSTASIAQRWKESGVPDPAVKLLQAGDPWSVAQAFEIVATVAGPSDEVTRDFCAVVKSGLLCDATPQTVAQNAGILRLIGRSKTERTTNALEETHRVMLALDAQPPRGELLADAACFLLPTASPEQHQNLVRHFVEDTTPDVRQEFCKGASRTLLAHPASLHLHVQVCCARIDKLVGTVTKTDDTKDPVIAYVEQILRILLGALPTYRKDPAGISTVREHIFPMLIRSLACTSARVQQIALTLFTTIYSSLREPYAVEIESVFHGALLPMLASKNSSSAQVARILDELRTVCSEAQHLVDLFINYDCTQGRRAVFEPLWSKIVDLVTRHPDPQVRQSALNMMVSIVQAFNQWMDRFEVDIAANEAGDRDLASPPPATTPTDIAADLQSKKATEIATHKLNAGQPEACFECLKQHGFVNDKADFGKWLYDNNHFISKVVFGEYVGKAKPDREEVLKAFANAHDFAGLQIDEALRTFLGGFKLVGEAQVVDRTMEVFSNRYCTQNPTAFKSPSTAFVLAFSMCMLNTDAHSVNVAEKMTADGFIRNNRGIDDGDDLPEEVLRGIYTRITAAEIRLRMGPADHVDMVSKKHVSRLAQIPILKHLSPVVGLVSDAVMLPVDIAASLTGYAQVADRKRTEALFASEINSIVSETVAAMAFTRAGPALVAANSLQHIIPILHMCADGLSAGFTAALRRESDVEFDLGIKGTKHAVHACCRVARGSQVIQLCAELSHACQVFVDGDADVQPRHVAALRTLYDVVLRNADDMPTESWQILLRLHSALVSRDVFAPESDPGAATAQKTTSWFRRSEDEHKHRRTRSEKARMTARSAVPDLTRAKLENVAALRPATRLMIVQNLTEVCATDAKLNARCTLIELLTAVMSSCAGVAARSQWHQMWSLAGPVFLSAASLAGDHFEDIVDMMASVAIKYLRREDQSAAQEQSEVLRTFETLLLHSTSANQVIVIRALRNTSLTTCHTLTSGWKVVFRSFGASAHLPALADEGYRSVSDVLRAASDIVVERRYAPEAVACLMGFVCAQTPKALALDALRQASEIAGLVQEADQFMSVCELFMSVGAGEGTRVELREPAIEKMFALLEMGRCTNPASVVVPLAARIAASDANRAALGPVFVRSLSTTGPLVQQCVPLSLKTWCNTCDLWTPWEGYIEHWLSDTAEPAACRTANLEAFATTAAEVVCHRGVTSRVHQLGLMRKCSDAGRAGAALPVEIAASIAEAVRRDLSAVVAVYGFAELIARHDGPTTDLIETVVEKCTADDVDHVPGAFAIAALGLLAKGSEVARAAARLLARDSILLLPARREMLVWCRECGDSAPDPLFFDAITTALSGS
jgi:hypothetical protein